MLSCGHQMSQYTSTNFQHTALAAHPITNWMQTYLLYIPIPKNAICYLSQWSQLRIIKGSCAEQGKHWKNIKHALPNYPDRNTTIRSTNRWCSQPNAIDHPQNVSNFYGWDVNHPKIVGSLLGLQHFITMGISWGHSHQLRSRLWMFFCRSCRSLLSIASRVFLGMVPGRTGIEKWKHMTTPTGVDARIWENDI